MESRSKHFRKRDAILTYLRQTDAHPSAETVYAGLKEQIPDISLGTVYRNLALFKQQGLIASLGTVNGIERFDGNTKSHVHFICTVCDSVSDLHRMAVPDTLSSEAAAHTGGKVNACLLSFTGVCARCSNSN